MSAAPVVRSPWIVGPRYDLAFFSTLWLPPLLVLATAFFAGLEVGAGFFALWIYHLLIRLPHFAAMLRVTYLRRSQWSHYAHHWVRYFAIPLLILLLYGAPLLGPDGYRSDFGFVITTVAYLWGYQHIGMQNYGILQLYRMRAGRAGDADRGLEKLIYYAIIVSVCAAEHLTPVVRFVSGVRPGRAVVDAVNASLLSVAAALALVYLARLVRAGGRWSPAVLYFTVSVLAMVQWPFYDELPTGSWFLVFNGHHSVAYLGLLFLMTWNQDHPDQRLSFAAGARAYLVFWLPLVVVGLLLILLTAGYQSARLSAGYAAAGSGDFELLLGFFVCHYYVESLVWHFRSAHNRETTLPLLRAPRIAAEPQGSPAPAQARSG